MFYKGIFNFKTVFMILTTTELYAKKSEKN